MVNTATRILVILCFSLSGLAQTQVSPANPTQPSSTGTVPIYSVTVVGRTIQAISYRTLSGSTNIAFRSTSLLPKASGKAKVTSKLSATRVQAEFKNLSPPTTFGPEYLTYILWGITPDGRPLNMAEIVPDSNGNAKVDVTVNYQAFGMIVTAEPYFAVSMPSDVVVLQNQVTSNTKGKIVQIEAKYQLLKRGQYTENVNPSEVQPIVISPNTPLAIYEAENALKIAQWAGADHYAADTFNKARKLLTQAQDYQSRKQQKPAIMTARESVQTAADARTISIDRQREEARAQAKAAQDAQAAAAKAKAQQEAAARAQAEAQAEKAQAAQAAAEAAQQQAQAQAQQAQLAAQAAHQRAAQAENQQEQMRARLLQQLNSILQTRQTPQGLVVTMSQVAFDTGRYSLHQDTRIMLAKLAGVLLAYPGISIQVNGYTDNTGNAQSNQVLSQKRADAVRNFLVQQGVPASSIQSQGFGEANPVAPNDTATGRGMNRRVEIVITGNSIGLHGGAASASGGSQ